MNKPIAPTDPCRLIESLDPDALRDRIAELDRQITALRVLLRSALARHRHRQAQEDTDER
jgi:phage shock protein A